MRADATGAGRLRGYAGLFGRPDLAGDRIEPGAFAASLVRRGASGLKMLWQHDPGQPIGAWTRVYEDAAGLVAEGQLALDTQKGREVDALIRAGAVDGLSIGFKTRRARRDAGGGRRLVEIDLWEISVVTFPMQEGARIARPASAQGADGLAARLRTEAARLGAA
ncbi:HK97 family phage prohead protease [Mangrovibrevibacter kandeliae]|uniref:HK97 family phage prohead protease n=1 Tax=Mangrovibrevibacter kandeliae TaxID=2968473 RepID=UPI002118BF82|nr:HK97 family phage prohead protease [Aurantimonas sp. CSK15Z-1]MCQ8781077.1 HK97 family phage prohead protease [Aurantimonas sp. CSK15Z-1]